MSNNENIPLMWTIPEAGEKSGFGAYRIRQWAKDGSIISVCAGRKILVNADSISRYLETGKKQGIPAALSNESESAGRVSPIPFRGGENS